jgi:23S rRNA C2498 (ribose-2'-O)-methylase RlmM
VGEHFGISRGTVTNISKIPYRKEHYDKMISELTNLKNQMADRIFNLELETKQLQSKLKQYE